MVVEAEEENVAAIAVIVLAVVAAAVVIGSLLMSDFLSRLQRTRKKCLPDMEAGWLRGFCKIPWILFEVLDGVHVFLAFFEDKSLTSPLIVGVLCKEKKHELLLHALLYSINITYFIDLGHPLKPNNSSLWNRNTLGWRPVGYGSKPSTPQWPLKAF